MKKRYYIARFTSKFYYPNIEQCFTQDNSIKFNSQTARYLMILGTLLTSFVITDLFLFSHIESKLISVFSKAITFCLMAICYWVISLNPKSYLRLFIAANIAFVLYVSNIVIITGVYIQDPITPIPPTVFEALVPYLIVMLLIGIMPALKSSIQFSFLTILLGGYFTEVYLYYSFKDPLLGYSITYLIMMFIVSTIVAFSMHRYKRLMWARSYEAQLHFKQISRQKRELSTLNDKLQQLTLIDDLTQIANRRSFNEELSSASDLYKRNQTHFSLFIIDIDHFKKVNDTFGHPTGDLLLRHVAKVIAQSIRSTDKLFRVGGEEFSIISFDESANKNETLATRIQSKLIQDCLTVDGHTFEVTVSLGICSANDASKNFKDIYALADKALYKAKTARNTFEIHTNDKPTLTYKI